MLLAVLVALLTLSTTCRAVVDFECKMIAENSPTLKLKRYLFCDYDSTVRPVTKKDTAINVTLSLTPLFMDYVESTSIFVLQTWFRISWKDEHLTWKPEDYNGVEAIRVKSNSIWVPDLATFNSGDMEGHHTGVPDTICQLLHTGTIVCVPTVKLNAQCEADYTYWPYDIQECSIHMGSWTHTGEEISFRFRRESIDMTNFVPHKQWLISNYTREKYILEYKCCPNDTFPTLILDFKLQRHSSMIHAVFITPAVALMVITLTVLWLDSRSVERISLAAVNFICHMLCIYDLHWMLPANGSSTPHILLFYRDSMALATFAMVITALLRKLQSMTISPPGWIITTVQIATSNRAGRFLLLDNNTDAKVLVNSDHDEENIVGSVASTTNSRDDSWQKLTIIVEWLALIVGVLTYTFMIFLRVPMSH